MPIRLLCWNVHGLRDDTAALVRLVRELDPDVMCVQEAPKYWRWRAKCAALAQECGLTYVAGGGSTGGTALFVHLRVGVRAVLEVPLSRQWGWPDRGLAAAVVGVDGVEVAVASLHLPLDRAQRLEQVQRILRLVRVGRPDRPVLAAGDLNERPSGPTWQALAEAGWRDLGPGSGPTFPAVAPDRRIDGVLGNEGILDAQVEVVDDPRVTRASDHRPLLATVQLADSTGAIGGPGLASGAHD